MRNSPKANFERVLGKYFIGMAKLCMQKAVWLTNIDSEVMNSRKNLAEGLRRLADLGFNTILIQFIQSFGSGVILYIRAKLPSNLLGRQFYQIVRLSVEMF